MKNYSIEFYGMILIIIFDKSENKALWFIYIQ